MNIKKLSIIIIILTAITLCYKNVALNKVLASNNIDKIPEPIYTQDCFPRTLQQSGVSKKCFENANFGKKDFCTKAQIRKIKKYYKKGQDKDPLNDGTIHFCADEY